MNKQDVQPEFLPRDRYESPFSARYAGREMQRLFSERHRALAFRRMWIILATCQQQLGLPITDEQIAEMKAQQENIDLARVHLHEKALRHDVMAHIHAYAEVCPKAAPILHLGATSCYVTDNADLLIMKEALLLLRASLVDLAHQLAAFAAAQADQPCLAFTHFQPAQPTTLGKRACLWLQDVLDDLLSVEAFLQNLRPLGSKGTTGTMASFKALFEGQEDKAFQLDQLVAQQMGFARPVAVSGQTYSRKTDYKILSLLSGIAQSASKFAHDLRLLQHMKEVEEPFESTQVGSSAMPYKRNPMRSERMTAIARFLMNNAGNAAQTAATQWLERTLDDSANRRIALAEGFLAADGLLTLYRNVAGGLVVYPRMMQRRLMEELPFMASEDILMRAVLKGGDRQQLHERLRVHAQQAGDRVKKQGEQNDLIERVAGDPAFQLDREELNSLLDPAAYTGLASQQTRRYLAGEVADILSRFQQEALPQADISL